MEELVASRASNHVSFSGWVNMWKMQFMCMLDDYACCHLAEVHVRRPEWLYWVEGWPTCVEVPLSSKALT